MNWFGKNKKEEEKKDADSPLLSELPKLPELPKLKEDDNFSDEMPELPPRNLSSFRERFSKNATNQDVSGNKEDEEDFDADESAENEWTMQKPRKTIPMGFLRKNPQREMQTQKSFEPVFVRIDKFEEGLDMFEKAKQKLSEIEEFLAEMKRVNEKEERELEKWESEILSIKKNFEKMDKNIFSRV